MSISSMQYAGHSAIFFESSQGVLAIDPWLEGNPKCPEELKSPKALDLIVLSHGHSDHAGDVVRLAKHYGSTVVATFELAMLLIAEGVPESQILPMNKGGSLRWKSLKISLTHALHSNSFDSSSGPKYAGEACGVILGDGTKNIYHAGDTALFSDMKLIAEEYAPLVSLLPIGDRFTMGPKEAAKAAALLRSPRCVPIHYGTFDMLTGSAQEFQAALQADKSGQETECVVLKPGERLSF